MLLLIKGEACEYVLVMEAGNEVLEAWHPLLFYADSNKGFEVVQSRHKAFIDEQAVESF